MKLPQVDYAHRVQSRLWATFFLAVSGVAAILLVAMTIKVVVMAFGWFESPSAPTLQSFLVSGGVSLVFGLLGYGLWKCQKWAQVTSIVLGLAILVIPFPSTLIAVLFISLFLFGQSRERKQLAEAVQRLEIAIGATSASEQFSAIDRLIDAGGGPKAVNACRDATRTTYDVATNFVRNWNSMSSIVKLHILARNLENTHVETNQT